MTSMLLSPAVRLRPSVDPLSYAAECRSSGSVQVLRITEPLSGLLFSGDVRTALPATVDAWAPLPRDRPV